MSSKNYYDKYWKSEHTDYGHVNKPPSWPQKELESYYNAVKNYIGNNVLDIGSGDGTFLKFLTEKRSTLKKVCGLDISSSVVEESRGVLPSIDFPDLKTKETKPSKVK